MRSPVRAIALPDLSQMSRFWLDSIPAAGVVRSAMALRSRFALACIACSLAGAGFLRAAEGDLDLTFGNGGKVSTDVGGFHDEVQALARQLDGKLVAAGFAQRPCNAGCDDFALARYDTDGTLDASFGTNGKVTRDFGGLTDRASAVAVQADGKIVVAGFTTPAGSCGSGCEDFALARYDVDGTLDPSFGTGGTVTTDFEGLGDQGRALVLQPDGKVVVAGFTTPAGGCGGGCEDFALARYHTDGTLDASFGTNGKVTHDFGGLTDRASAVAVQADGKIVVAGFTTPAGSCGSGCEDFALARYDVDGTLDPSFGTGGTVTTDFEGLGDQGRALVLQPDGKVVVAGFTTPAGGCGGGCEDFALARYNPDASLDGSFGSGGTVSTDFEGFGDEALALVLEPGGSLVAGGYMTSTLICGNLCTDFALVRYRPDGTLDPAFGAGGRVVTVLGTYDDKVMALVREPDGDTVAGGFVTDCGAACQDFALARYTGAQSASALIDSAGGAFTTPDGTLAVTVPPDTLGGPTVVSATSATQSGFGVGSTDTNLVLLGDFEPEGVLFDPPVTIVFTWSDADADGFVDGTAILEGTLRAFRNGVQVAGTVACEDQVCTPAACCDQSANTWTIQVSQFSEYAVGTEPCLPATTARLKLTKTALPAGDDGLKFAGSFVLAGPIGSLLDPVANGVGLRLVDTRGTVVEQAIPPGPFDPVTKRGWKVTGGGEKWKFSSPSPNAPARIVKVALADRSMKTPGLVAFAFKGKDGSYPAQGTTIDADVMLPVGGKCFAADFAGPPPAPSCVQHGDTLRCK